MYKAVIFDFFDVIRTDPYNAWLKRHGIERTGEYEDLARQLDKGQIDLDTFFGYLSSLSGHPLQTLKYEYENTKTVDKKLPQFIGELKECYKIGLLSNAASSYVRGLLTKHDYEKLFDAIVISSEVQLIKPTDEAFNRILQQLRIKAEQAIFIDDNKLYVEAAKKYGIASIHFTGLQPLKDKLQELGV